MPAAQDLTNVLLDGRYRLVRLMGEGGMGQVYEGMHETLDRKVAVKVLLPRYAYEPKFRERFLREAKAASKVRHPNVVHILDFGDTPSGSVYFAMEFLEGRDLAALLREQGRLPWPRARHILLQAIGALAAAHERKIIHRDIKPANFFIEDGGPNRLELVKVLDFGIAKLAASAGSDESSLAQSLTSTGEVFGTAKYMAPEQAYGASDDPRVDVYSLGIVAYELATGRVPFSGVSVFDIVTRHVNEPPRPPRELVPEISEDVEAWILRAIAKRPDQRFASMVEMEEALLAISAGVTTEGSIARNLPPPSGLVPAMPVASPGPAVQAAKPGPDVPVAGLPGSPMPAAPMPRLPVPGAIAQRPAPALPATPILKQVPGVSPAPSMPATPIASPGSGFPAPPPAAATVDPSRPVSEMITAQSLLRPAEAAHVSTTSVIPTRLKAPSPVTSGELLASGPIPVVSAAPASTSSSQPVHGSEDSGIGSSTARLRAAEDGTGPTHMHGSGSRTAETDQHRFTASRPVVASHRPSFVLGLLGTLGGAAAVLAGYLVIASNGDEPSETEPSPVVSAAEPAAPTSPSPSVSVPATPSAGSEAADPTPPVVVEPAPASPSPVEPAPGPEVVSEPEPPPEPVAEPVAATPARKPASKPAAGKPKPAMPLTDAEVELQLARTLKKKCGSLASGTKVTVTVMVGSTGRVLSALSRGATGTLKECLLTEAVKGKFPSGSPRPVPVDVSL